MSMLSDQAKQLRDTADRLDRIANVSTPWIHANLVPMLREAADTIISLRDRLQDAELGRGTCENIAMRYLDFLCSECGFVHYIDDSNCTGDGNDWNYCPNCGRKVEQ